MALDRKQDKRKHINGIPQSFKMALAVRIARRLFPLLCDSRTASTPAADSIEKIICHMESFCRDPSAASAEVRFKMDRNSDNVDDILRHIIEEKAQETAAPATPTSPILVIDSSRYDRIANALSAALRLWEIERAYVLQRSKFSNADLRDSYVNQQAFVALQNKHWGLLTDTVVYARDASVAVDQRMEKELWNDLETSYHVLDTMQSGIWRVSDPVPEYLYLIPSDFDLTTEPGGSAIREIVFVMGEKLVAYFRRHPNRIKELSPRQFEELICEIVGGFGWKAKLTRQTADGGYDIVALDHHGLTNKYLIECKRYTKRPVGIVPVRALLGVTTHEKATKGILVTTSRFTKGARELFDEHEWRLEGRDFQGLLEWLELCQRAKLSQALID
jgi:hypothetical protein